MTTPKDPKPAFDADYSPSADVNKRAAKARGLRYDGRREVYVDEDGLPARDRFGQDLG